MSLNDVDWSMLPMPEDDGAAAHLLGTALPCVKLPATGGDMVDLGALPGTAVLYIYPMTGTPGIALPDGWDAIPGARGCTPQSCAFRDHFAELREAGADALFGISAQSPAEHSKAAARLHLPFPLLSDADGALATALRLPQFEVGGRRLLKRLTLIVRAGRIAQVHYPVFPPDADAPRVLAWLHAHPGSGQPSAPPVPSAGKTETSTGSR